MTVETPVRGLEHAWDTARSIDGWLSRDQAAALYARAAAVSPGSAIVEIGSHQGRSTLMLAAAKRAGVRLVAVDPWDDPRWGGGAAALDAFRATLAAAGQAANVEVFRGFSSDAIASWNGNRIGLLFVDGAHDVASVLIDLDGWAPYVELGGALAVHDAFSSLGVTRALAARHFLNRRFRYVGRHQTLVLYERRDLALIPAARSLVRQGAQLPYFARNAGVKIAIRRGWPAVHRALGHAEATDPY